MSKLNLGLNKCSNKEYHADKEYLSSSSLKLLLEDPAKFYEEKILGNKPLEEENAAFSEGSLTHTLILEPHLVDKEFTFFSGLRKAGPEWEEFKAANDGRTILSAPQRARCMKNLESFKKSKPAVELINGGEAEFTICQELQGVKIKVRADYINVDKGYIADVKTSGFPVTPRESFSFTMDRYKYDLSAALYAQVAEQFYGKKFEFYFIAISKPKSLLELGECQVYRVSKDTRARGDHMVSEALSTYKRCMATGLWQKPVAQFSDEIEEV